MMVYLNGQLVEETEAVVSIDDRGFLFADGVYEVVHVYGKNMFAWDLHLTRLERSLAALEIEGVDVGELRGAAEDLVARAETAEAALYIQITRGVHRRQYAPPAPGTVAPTVLMWVRPVSPLPAEDVTGGVAVITVPDDRWAKVWIKTTGLLPNVLAKAKAQREGCFEAVFVRDGMVTEATSANIFLVKNGVLRTAPETNYILPGVTRHVVLEMAAAAGMAVQLVPFSVDDMLGADEVFLTGTMTEVLPVTRIDGHPVGREAGPVARLLLAKLHERAWSPVDLGR